MIKETQLDNGLRVVSERLTQVESVAIGLWINVGLFDEPEPVSGINHYLEHMLFKGTERRTARQIAAEIDNVGGHLNGYTDREFTCLYARLLDEDLPLGVNILFDMALHSSFNPRDIEMEREVIIQEARRLEDNAEEYVHELAVETAWQGHPLGRSLHGTEESIRAISRENLVDHFHNHYFPERMLVAAAGALEHDKLVALVESATKHLKAGDTAPEQTNPSFHDEEKRLARDTEQVHLCLALPGSSQASKDRYTMAICDTLLGGSSSSRLFQEIRENRGLAYSIGSYSILCRNTGLFLIHAGTSSDNLSEVLGLVRAELENLQKNGVSEEELTWAKSHVHGSLALARESTSFRMQRLANGMLYEGKVVPHRRLLQRFEKVSMEDISRVAKRFFSANPTIITVGPAG